MELNQKQRQVIEQLIADKKLIKTGILVDNPNLRDCWTIAGTSWNVNLSTYKYIGGFYPKWNSNRTYTLSTFPAYKQDAVKRAEVEIIRSLFDAETFPFLG